MIDLRVDTVVVLIFSLHRILKWSTLPIFDEYYRLFLKFVEKVVTSAVIHFEISTVVFDDVNSNFVVSSKVINSDVVISIEVIPVNVTPV